jgi:hypothetical protein
MKTKKAAGYKWSPKKGKPKAKAVVKKRIPRKSVKVVKR